VTYSRGIVAEWRAVGRARTFAAPSDKTDLAITLSELSRYAGADGLE
jgi:hypothetical protein